MTSPCDVARRREKSCRGWTAQKSETGRDLLHSRVFRRMPPAIALTRGDRFRFHSRVFWRVLRAAALTLGDRLAFSATTFLRTPDATAPGRGNLANIPGWDGMLLSSAKTFALSPEFSVDSFQA